MMKHFNLNVIYLKRIEFGNLVLPENLKIGEWKEIDKNVIKKFKKYFAFFKLMVRYY